MPIIKIYEGGLGENGQNGQNGSGVSDIRKSIVDNPLINILNPNNLGDLTWTRAGDGAYINSLGIYSFKTGNEYTNHITQSNTFTATWLDFFSEWTGGTKTQPDPEGGNLATDITFDVDTRSGTISGIGTPTIFMTDDKYYRFSVWIKKISGTFDSIDFSDGNGNLMHVATAISTSWVQYKFIASKFDTGGRVHIKPRCSAGSVLHIYQAQATEGHNLHETITTTGAAVTISNPDPVFRSNRSGYLIENAKTNICPNSERLQLWNLSSGTLIQDTDLFGESDNYNKLTFSTIPTVTLSQPITYTAGAAYTVSLFCHLTAGDLTAITIRIGDGAEVFLPPSTTNGYTRLSAKVIAGTTGDLIISLTSNSLTAVPKITGVQIETGELSSYIRTTNTAITRAADLVVVDESKIPNLSKDFSVIVNVSAFKNDSTKRVLLSNEQTGADEFAIYTQNDNIKVQAGSNLLNAGAISQYNSFSMTYNSATDEILFYKNGILSGSNVNAFNGFTDSGTALKIGADLTNAIDDYIKRVAFYDEILTAAEIEAILL